jgi:predicted site-specific integrase-resolvase
VSDQFYFTVTDLARFLGKSAVTLRTWERNGLVDLPRDSGGDRKLSAEDVRRVAKTAYELGRINLHRLHLVDATVTLLTIIETEN